MPAVQSTRFCFTLSGYDNTDPPTQLIEACTLLVFSEELGAEGNNPHLQGYLETSNRRTEGGLNQLCRFTSWHHIHFEIARGTRQEALAYLRKEPGHVYHEVKNGARVSTSGGGGGGSKVEWSEAYELAKVGGSAAVGAVFPKAAICHHTNLEAIYKKHRSEEELPALNSCGGLWICGLSGTGKTTLARAIDKKPYLKVLSAERWDGWKDQKVVIFEDVDKTHNKHAHLFKNAGDKFPFAIQVIYEGAQQIRPKLAAVTSQYEIEDIWPDHETRTALNRRYSTLRVEVGQTDGERLYWFRPALPPSGEALPFQNLGEMENAVSFLRARFGLEGGSASASGATSAEADGPSASAPTTPATMIAMPSPSQAPIAEEEAPPTTPSWMLYPTQLTESQELAMMLEEVHVDMTQDSDEE